MASNYPGSADSFDTIAADKKQSDTVGGRTQAVTAVVEQARDALRAPVEAVGGSRDRA